MVGSCTAANSAKSSTAKCISLKLTCCAALAFARLHRLSGLLNGAVMLAGVLALAAVGLRR